MAAHEIAGEDFCVGTTPEGSVEHERVVLGPERNYFVNDDNFEVLNLHVIGEEQTAVAPDVLHLLLWPGGHVLSANHQQ